MIFHGNSLYSISSDIYSVNNYNSLYKFVTNQSHYHERIILFWTTSEICAIVLFNKSKDTLPQWPNIEHDFHRAPPRCARDKSRDTGTLRWIWLAAWVSDHRAWLVCLSQPCPRPPAALRLTHWSTPWLVTHSTFSHAHHSFCGPYKYVQPCTHGNDEIFKIKIVLLLHGHQADIHCH